MEGGSSGSRQIFGVQELYRPENDIELDIVAIHGLNGDPIKTWTHASGNSKINWLSHQDFLPRYVKNARVLTWGYNANINSINGRETSSDRIMQHAQTLVAQLQADRELEGTSDKPIIFICHSLGGIVVKRALAYAASRTAPKIAHLHSIYTCTFAILFFGTPHMGASKARLLGSLQKLASLTVPKRVFQIESSLLNALEKESETLQNITDQFAPLMSNFRIFFFWEQERTDLTYTKDYIVDEASSAPILDNTERSGIAADHRGMCKFEKNTDQGFRTAVAALRRYKQEASEVIRERTARASAAMSDRRWHEATELVGGPQEPSRIGYRLDSAGGIDIRTGCSPPLLPYREPGAPVATARMAPNQDQEGYSFMSS